MLGTFISSAFFYKNQNFHNGTSSLFLTFFQYIYFIFVCYLIVNYICIYDYIAVGFLAQEAYHPFHPEIGGMAITHMASLLHLANNEGDGIYDKII